MKPINVDYRSVAPILFCTFLRKRKAYYTFIRHLGAHSSGALRSYLEGTKPALYFASAFCWKTTPEGPDYWSNLDSEWYHIIKHLDF